MELHRILLFLAVGLIGFTEARVYYGESAGTLSTLHHLVTGQVYIVDRNTIRIRGFSYDGSAPDAFFWAGVEGVNPSTPSADGTKLNDEKGRSTKLGVYNNADLVLTLPQGVTADKLTWLSVWCRDFSADFGHVIFPKGLTIPAPRDIGEFSRLAHQVSSGVVTVQDAKTILIRNLRYDGLGPDAYFYVGPGTTPHHNIGTKVPDENGSLEKLRAYGGVDITLRLPGDLTVHDIDWLSMWCVLAQQNFGDVRLPQGLVVPPFIEKNKDGGATEEPALANCQQLHKHLNVAWQVIGEDLVLELTGALDTDGYMAFGLSGSDTGSMMIGADVIVAYYDDEMQQYVVEDYTLTQYAMCGSAGEGACPDTKRGGQNNVQLIAGRYDQGITTIRLSRPLRTTDLDNDRTIMPDSKTYVVWAMGRLTTDTTRQVTKHDLTLKGDLQLQFGMEPSPVATCAEVEVRDSGEPGVKAWEGSMLMGDDTKVFTVQIGPTGGERGYRAITGRQSWGIAYYVNGILIPELYLRRGDTYTFLIETGGSENNTAKYHPFYITDDPQGGYSKTNPTQKQRIQNYLGVQEDGMPTPNAVGRYCEYRSKSAVDQAATSESFEQYKATLMLVCEEGQTGTLTWTVPQNVPDLLYYQCWAHNYFGWKIHVLDKDEVINSGVCLHFNLMCIITIVLTIILER